MMDLDLTHALHNREKVKQCAYTCGVVLNYADVTNDAF